MKRNRKIVVLSHCIINCNSKVEGLSVYEGALDFTKKLIDNGFGIIQLPCPELLNFGLKRWGNSKEQFNNLIYKERCKELLKPYIVQFDLYKNSGYEINSIIAIDGSPSCGYNKTCSSSIFSNKICEYPNSIIKREKISLINEKGVFIEVLCEMLKEFNLDIKILGLDESDLENSSKKILNYILK